MRTILYVPRRFPCVFSTHAHPLSSISLWVDPLANLNIENGTCFQSFRKLTRGARVVCPISEPIGMDFVLDPPRLLFDNVAYCGFDAKIPLSKHIVAVGWTSSFVNFKHLRANT